MGPGDLTPLIPGQKRLLIHWKTAKYRIVEKKLVHLKRNRFQLLPQLSSSMRLQAFK